MMRRLRIGYYMAPYSEGGIARHAVALIDDMRERHSVVVFCDPRSKTFRAALAARGIDARDVASYPREKRGLVRPAASGWRPFQAARDAFGAERFDLVHFHAGRLGALYPAILASRATGIPTRLLTVHNAILARSVLQRFFEARVLNTLDRIVAVCGEVKDDLVAKKHVAPEKISVIANGVDAAEFDAPGETAALRRELGVDEAALVVGAVGRLDAYKGIDILIRAAARLRARRPALRVVLIGAGPHEGALKELAEKEGSADIVRFAGYRADARRLMHAIDIITIPSRHEAQPFTLLEAMAARKPVVAAAVGGIPGIMVDGVTGLLFPSGDIDAFTQALEKLLADKNSRTAMGNAARERVGREFSQSAMLEKLQKLYTETARKEA
jgi:glycosyltransferase involved in cell wall biosynthesis